MPLQLQPASRVEALPHAALAKLARFLSSCVRAGSMPLEAVDGFFAALIVGRCAATRTNTGRPYSVTT